MGQILHPEERTLSTRETFHLEAVKALLRDITIFMREDDYDTVMTIMSFIEHVYSAMIMFMEKNKKHPIYGMHYDVWQNACVYRDKQRSMSTNK